MSATEDISWHVLRRITQDWLGESADLVEVKPLVGGAINTTLLLETRAGEKGVLKITPHRVNRDFEREAHQLRVLREMGLPAPHVYQLHIGTLEHPFSYLLMEFLPGIDLGRARHIATASEFERLQERLADMVCSMHERRHERYQRVLPEGHDRAFESWPAFYRHVYDEIWHETEKSPLLPTKVRKQIGKVHEKLERLIIHGDCPRLVHWDIWATNLLVRPDERTGEWQISALLDPNCKFAHTEAEIAYMELFHTVTPAFMRSYQQRFKLHPDYHKYRKHIYQLYPLINHVRLFGQDYVKPLMTTLERVGGMV